MANLFSKNRNVQTLSPRQIYEQKYNTSRMNLLLVVIFTAINIILLATNSDMYFLFSAFIPLYITDLGNFLCGRYPADVYVEAGVEGMEFFNDSVFIIMVIISVIITLLYLLAWFMSSKNRSGWLIFSLALFGLDTIGMLLLGVIALDSILDILFHAWIIYYLILGIYAHSKLKNLPIEEEPIAVEGSETTVDGEPVEDTENAAVKADSPIIREADKTVKNRIFVEARVFNLDICYRRVKRTNELVINGNVYDEYEALVEQPHSLNAEVNGHYVEAGYSGTHSYISVDGEPAVKKMRMF